MSSNLYYALYKDKRVFHLYNALYKDKRIIQIKICIIYYTKINMSSNQNLYYALYKDKRVKRDLSNKTLMRMLKFQLVYAS